MDWSCEQCQNKICLAVEDKRKAVPCKFVEMLLRANKIKGNRWIRSCKETPFDAIEKIEKNNLDKRFGKRKSPNHNNNDYD